MYVFKIREISIYIYRQIMTAFPPWKSMAIVSERRSTKDPVYEYLYLFYEIA
jgi:hypothetical protein